MTTLTTTTTVATDADNTDNVDQQNSILLSTVVNNLSDKKLCIITMFLFIGHLACVLIAIFISLSPASSETVKLSSCLLSDENDTRWFTPECQSTDSPNEEQKNVTTVFDIVLAVKMPPHNMGSSRWQQNVRGMLLTELFLRPNETAGRMGATIDLRLAYRNKWDPEDQWTYYAGDQQEHILDWTVDYNNKTSEYLNSSEISLFQLASFQHDEYLLNFRFISDSKTYVYDNKTVALYSDFYLHIIYLNESFTKTFLTIKTIYFLFDIGITIWLWRRIRMLSRKPSPLEYMVVTAGGASVLLNMPVEFLMQHFNVPYMLLFNDIREELFSLVLLAFCLIFAWEHIPVKNNVKKRIVTACMRYLSCVVPCIPFLIYDFLGRGLKLHDPFFITEIFQTLEPLLYFLDEVSFFTHLLYLTCATMGALQMLNNIHVKDLDLPGMNTKYNWHYKGVLFRYKYLMLVNCLCAGYTSLLSRLNRIYSFLNTSEWYDNIQFSCMTCIAIYGFWNICICIMMLLLAPTEKPWPDDLTIKVKPQKVSRKTRKRSTPRTTEV